MLSKPCKHENDHLLIKIRCTVLLPWLQKLSENHVTQFVNYSFKYLSSLVDLERITIEMKSEKP